MLDIHVLILWFAVFSTKKNIAVQVSNFAALGTMYCAESFSSVVKNREACKMNDGEVYDMRGKLENSLASILFRNCCYSTRTRNHNFFCGISLTEAKNHPGQHPLHGIFSCCSLFHSFFCAISIAIKLLRYANYALKAKLAANESVQFFPFVNNWVFRIVIYSIRWALSAHRIQFLHASMHRWGAMGALSSIKTHSEREKSFPVWEKFAQINPCEK